MGVREVVVLLVVAVFLGGVIALFLPRKWVALIVKQIIACVWIALGLVEIVIGASDSTPAGAWMAITGLSEVAMFGGALLLFADERWMRVIGGYVVFLGVALLAAAGSLRNSVPHN
jgi:uncharacterized membrane protein YraQ (UPF0718 family)